MLNFVIRCAASAVALCAVCISSASADVVFQNTSNNGFFTPFNPSNAGTGIKYGDSGWIGSGGGPYTLTSITLGLAAFGGTANGKTDLLFTFNDGDPSGLVFGTGATLYSTTIENVPLPAATGGSPQYFDLTIPLPGVLTDGNFNNVGWSVAIANYNYDGQFGFQCSTAGGQTIGFYTNNASFYDGTSWSLFSFGSDPNTGVANFVATIQTPEPGPLGAALLLVAAGATLRCRNHGRSSVAVITTTAAR